MPGSYLLEVHSLVREKGTEKKILGKKYITTNHDKTSEETQKCETVKQGRADEPGLGIIPEVVTPAET